MKNLILLIVMLVSINVFAQFKTAAITTFGIDIDSELNTTAIQGTAGIEQQYKMNDLSFSLIALSYFKNEDPVFMTGPGIDYQVYKDPINENTFGFTARYLYGSQGEQLIGLGGRYTIDKNVLILFNGDWNYKNKSALLTIGTGYNFIK